jgi:hypothetical protein
MIWGTVRGAAAGALATAPMSVTMLALQRWLPGRVREPLPPRAITQNLLDAAGADDAGEERTAAATLAGHFGYGALCGALLAPLARGPGAGVACGLLVWAVSYLGLLPAARLFPSATDQPARQNVLMVAAHAVWGAALGLVLRRKAA